MTSYTKLFSHLITSTIWAESNETRIVWITILAIADQHGEVLATIPGLARLAGVSIPDCETAIQKLMSPDPYSRTKDMDGRRLSEIEGGWWIVTHAKHRGMASKDERKSSAAERQKRYRERNASVTHSNASVTPPLRSTVTRNATVTHQRDIAEAEEEIPAKPEYIGPKNEKLQDNAINSTSDQILQFDLDAGQNTNPKIPCIPEKPRRNKNQYSEEFAAWYETYPRKVAKERAQKAFLKLSAEERQQVINDNAALRYQGREFDKIPHPETYLNQKRFGDPIYNPNSKPESESRPIPNFFTTHGIPVPQLDIPDMEF